MRRTRGLAAARGRVRVARRRRGERRIARIERAAGARPSGAGGASWAGSGDEGRSSFACRSRAGIRSARASSRSSWHGRAGATTIASHHAPPGRGARLDRRRGTEGRAQGAPGHTHRRGGRGRRRAPRAGRRRNPSGRRARQPHLVVASPPARHRRFRPAPRRPLLDPAAEADEGLHVDVPDPHALSHVRPGRKHGARWSRVYSRPGGAAEARAELTCDDRPPRSGPPTSLRSTVDG